MSDAAAQLDAAVKGGPNAMLQFAESIHGAKSAANVTFEQELAKACAATSPAPGSKKRKRPAALGPQNEDGEAARLAQADVLEALASLADEGAEEQSDA